MAAIPAAIGYAEQIGLPYREGLIKSRYIGRTFIQPAQASRDQAVRMKFNPLPEVLDGKRVVVVDDSIVRGTTTGPIVGMLRHAGAREVHVRIHSPAMSFPCYMGVDTGRRNELIAATHSVEQIRQAIGNIHEATQQNLASTKQAERAAQDLNALGGKLLALVGGNHGARSRAGATG